MMPVPFMSMAILSRIVVSVVCGALLALILFQLSRDSKGRAFAMLVGALAANTTLSLTLRVQSLLGGDVGTLFQIIGVLTAALPALFLIFVGTCFDAWTARLRWVTRAYLGFIVLAGVLSALGALSYDIRMLPEGLLSYRFTPTAYVMLLVGLAGALYALGLGWSRWRMTRNRGDGQILAGLTIIEIGVVMVLAPGMSMYTIEQYAYAVGALVIAGPVLRRRLFDPLTQLNTRLTRRAGQLTAILRVGQQATSILSLPALLDGVVKEIHEAFGYYAVAIYLPDGDRLTARAAAGAAAAQLVASGEGRPLDASAHLLRHKALLEERSEPLHPGARSSMIIPLFAAVQLSKPTSLVGVLEVKSGIPAAFDDDDIEVFRILAGQIGTAIRNAELFQQQQRVDQYKTRFIHTISHELRTPLQTLLIRAQFLERPDTYSGVQLSADYLSDVHDTVKWVRHLKRLLDDILDMSRIEAGQIELMPKPVDPAAVLDEMQAAFAALAKPGVSIVRAYSANLPHPVTDDLRLKQILTNLVSNACKFTERGTICLGAQAIDGMIVFSVRDTGPGIPQSEQARLFGSFAQVNRQGAAHIGGSGLGLSISRQLARLLGGELWFESVEGQGATFYCRIPLGLGTEPADDQAASGAQVDIYPEKAARLPLQVLVVGIAPDKHVYMDKTSDPGASPYRVLAAQGCDEAIALADLISPDFVCAVDVGEDAVARLRMRLPQLEKCIIVATASTWWSALENAIRPHLECEGV